MDGFIVVEAAGAPAVDMLIDKTRDKQMIAIINNLGAGRHFRREAPDDLTRYFQITAAADLMRKVNSC